MVDTNLNSDVSSTTINNPILRLDHLSRVVDGKPIVNDISFEVAQGDIIAIVGPSGAGKSSLLRLLNRLDEPTSGTVYLHDQDYKQLPPRELRRRVGMVLQSPYLFPGTIADNLRFGPTQHGKTISDAAIEDLLDSVELDGMADRDISRLSGGEAQRVSLARTLANSPEILLLDEPTSALDENTSREVEALIRHIITDQKLTCLMVTHNLVQAERLANKAASLERGQLIKLGPVQEIIHA